MIAACSNPGEGCAMPHILVHDLDVHYRDEGNGITLVLGHSSTGSSGQWRELVKRMAGRYRLVAPDHIGYGRTAAYSGGMPVREHEITIVEALVHSPLSRSIWWDIPTEVRS
jgi:pimeloyl-ACP methyl ester carboxylesterase